MADTGSVRIVKAFTFRGGLRNFSNRYGIGTNTPADNAHWTTLCDAVVAAEKLIYAPPSGGGAQIIEAVGYAAGSDTPVFSKTYAVDGTGVFTFGNGVPGDCALLVRYSTPDRTTKNHPVYLFNYYHAMLAHTDALSPDLPHADQHAALVTYAAAWIAGFSDGTVTYHRAAPGGSLATAALVPAFFTHRDLVH
jgi:hypothetical protein